jgi:hypothetical protein
MHKLDLWFDSRQFTIAFVAATGDSTSVGKKSQPVATARLEGGGVCAERDHRGMMVKKRQTMSEGEAERVKVSLDPLSPSDLERRPAR